jgi:hypothetical protein
MAIAFPLLQDVFADASRSHLFEKARIETALAVPVFSGKTGLPAFVFCCYSFVRTGSVPFVLKFVQQALRLLWGGLDKVQPHASVGEDLWRDVAPADLGEMAADVEMQQHFIIKKRPIGAISNEPYARNDVDENLATQIETLEGPSGTPIAASIYTGRGTSSDYASTGGQGEEFFPSTMQPVQYQTFASVQNHIQEAIRSVGDMQPVHQHIATNSTGSKRAHVFQQQAPSQTNMQSSQTQQQHFFSQSQQQPQQQQTFLQQQLTAQSVYGTQQQSQSVQQLQTAFISQQHQPQQIFTLPSQLADQQQRGKQEFLPTVSAPLARPLALPDQVMNSQSAPDFAAMSRSEHHKGSTDSLQDLLRDPSLLQPTPTYAPAPVPDKVMETFQLGAAQQQHQQRHHLFTNAADPIPQMGIRQPEPSPNHVYSVPVDQLSASGISFAPLPIQPQANDNGDGGHQNQAFCMLVSQDAETSSRNEKVRLSVRH